MEMDSTLLSSTLSFSLFSFTFTFTSSAYCRWWSLSNWQRQLEQEKILRPQRTRKQSVKLWRVWKKKPPTPAHKKATSEAMKGKRNAAIDPSKRTPQQQKSYEANQRHSAKKAKERRAAEEKIPAAKKQRMMHGFFKKKWEKERTGTFFLLGSIGLLLHWTCSEHVEHNNELTKEEKVCLLRLVIYRY